MEKKTNKFQLFTLFHLASLVKTLLRVSNADSVTIHRALVCCTSWLNTLHYYLTSSDPRAAHTDNEYKQLQAKIHRCKPWRAIGIFSMLSNGLFPLCCKVVVGQLESRAVLQAYSMACRNYSCTDSKSLTSALAFSFFLFCLLELAHTISVRLRALANI